jgi:hypothetical protein
MKPLLDVFFQPGKVFASLNDRKGAWIVPLLVNMILVTASTLLVFHFIGLETIVRQRLAQTSLSPEQMQVAMQRATAPSQIYISCAFAAIGGGASMALIALVLFAFGLMTSREPKYTAMLAMVTLAFFPYFLISIVMTSLILLATPDKSTLDVTNLIATNVAAYMNREGMAKGMYSLLSSVDLLSFLEIALLSLGFSKLTKSSYLGGLAAVLGLWILYVSCKMAISLLF